MCQNLSQTAVLESVLNEHAKKTILQLHGQSAQSSASEADSDNETRAIELVRHSMYNSILLDLSQITMFVMCYYGNRVVRRQGILELIMEKQGIFILVGTKNV